jgi:pyrroline-5-carboxylate reductase
MNAVTALSGSGPAYVFLLMEVMAQAAEKMGLPHAVAVELARETVIGSGALADLQRSVPASTLRQNVTSPGGTTAAALEILNETAALQRLFDKAIEAATKRAEDLSRA